ncbi:MAG: c-type cytochrome [Hyphomicrobiaceae bacterium]|nr:c-type cytochrome [Hyphomicrobiaceae bacterium]
MLALATVSAGPARAEGEAIPPNVTAVPLGDAEHGGEVWFNECSGCHQIGPAAENAVGPNLTRIFGRRAATIEDFEYSDSLARQGRDGLIWDFDTLDAYITNPRTLVSGTRMGYPGLEDAEARADLLAFLRTFSDSPRDIPEAPATARRIFPDLPPEVLAIQGDPEYGEYLASECTTCHQRSGANEGIPSITNWPEEYFVLALHAYRSGLRPHPVMQMVTARLSDEEIAALAAYFATIQE